MKPQVTIVMATYNRAHFIVETLLSIQNQTFSDWECLIIDDGGTDNTKEVITPLLEKDSRFQFLKRPQNYLKGLPGCRNYGLDKAQGEAIIFFDDDDIVHPQNLELCVLELSRNTVSFCMYIRAVFFDKFDYNFDYSTQYTSFFITKSDVEKILKYQIFLNSCAIMWKRECFENNRFVETLMYAEDWELYSRIVSAGFTGISIEKSLFFARKHSNSLTGEFNKANPIQRASYSEAILLAVKNLKDKELLTYSLKRYFIGLSLQFEEFNLHKSIIDVLDLATFEKLKWQIFYAVLPLRLKLYRLKKVWNQILDKKG